MNVVRRMLQVAWNYNQTPGEMKAYELLSNINFYLGNASQASLFS